MNLGHPNRLTAWGGSSINISINSIYLAFTINLCLTELPARLNKPICPAFTPWCHADVNIYRKRWNERRQQRQTSLYCPCCSCCKNAWYISVYLLMSNMSNILISFSMTADTYNRWCFWFVKLQSGGPTRVMMMFGSRCFKNICHKQPHWV